MLENLHWQQPVCLLPTLWALGTVHVWGRLALWVRCGESSGGGFCLGSAWSGSGDAGEPRFLPSPLVGVGNSPRAMDLGRWCEASSVASSCIVGVLKARGLPGAARGRVPASCREEGCQQQGEVRCAQDERCGGGGGVGKSQALGLQAEGQTWRPGSVPFLIRGSVFGVSVTSSGVKRAETFLGYLRLPRVSAVHP